MADYRFLRRAGASRSTPLRLDHAAGGRYLPEYQKIRAANSFLTVCKTRSWRGGDGAARRAARVDAAILFSDILIPVEAMGVPLEFTNTRVRCWKGDPEPARRGRPPVPDPRRKSLRYGDDPYPPQGARGQGPLIGFSGAPFTLASYIVEGGTSKNFIQLKKLITRPRRSIVR